MNEDIFSSDINKLGIFGMNIGLIGAIIPEFCRQYEMGVIKGNESLISDPLGFILLFISIGTFYMVKESGGLSYYKNNDLERSEKIGIVAIYVVFLLMAMAFGYFLFNHFNRAIEMLGK